MAKWERLIDYPDYMVSDEGDIKRIEADGSLSDVPKEMDDLGYQVVYLKRPSGIVTEETVARLIAETFTDTNKWCQLERNNIKHLDGNVLNNRIENLQWVTEDDNTDDKHRQAYISETQGRTLYREARGKKGHPVICENVETGERLRFASQDDAEKYLGVKNISPVISGKQKTAAGYRIWREDPLTKKQI